MFSISKTEICVWNGAYKSSPRPLHLVPCLHGWPVGLAVTDGLTRSGLVVQMEFTLAVTKSLYDPAISQWPGWNGLVSFLVSSCLHHGTRMQVLLIVSLAAGLSNRAKEVKPKGTRCSVFSVLLLTVLLRIEPIAPGHPINQAERREPFLTVPHVKLRLSQLSSLQLSWWPLWPDIDTCRTQYNIFTTAEQKQK